MGESQEIKPLRPKEYYRDRIVKIVSEIQREDVLQYIYIIVMDIKGEEKWLEKIKREIKGTVNICH